MPDEPDISEVMSRLVEVQSQLTGIQQFVRATTDLDWEAEFDTGFPQFQDLLQQLTQWNRCAILEPPNPRRIDFSEYRNRRDLWTRLYTEAGETSGYRILPDDVAARDLWLAQPGEQTCAYAWSPGRDRNTFLLIAYRNAPARTDELDQTTAMLLLASTVFARGTVVAGRRIYYSEAFRRRFDRYDDLETNVAQVPRIARIQRVRDECFSLREQLQDIDSGPANATAFERVVEKIYEWVFAPSLGPAQKQEALFGGVKRVDIVFKNRASRGFWHDLSTKGLIACPYVFVECKNYGREVGNPEVDQLLGRFADTRGRVGFLVCNRIEDRMRLLNRCREAARDRRGWIVAIDKDDLVALLNARLLDVARGRASDVDEVSNLLDDHFRMLTF